MLFFVRGGDHASLCAVICVVSSGCEAALAVAAALPWPVAKLPI